MVEEDKTQEQIEEENARKIKLFGQKIKILRKMKEYTQEYCISVMGCSKRSWYRWERGLAYPLPIYRPKLLKIFPELGKIK